MRTSQFILLLSCWVGGVLLPVGHFAFADSARIKDLTSVQGLRGNQLIGYGLVVGLGGSGDSLRNSPFTGQSFTSMLERLGVNVRGANVQTKNVAAVMVTGDLPSFARPGARMDVTVSSLGDATSLAGGSLVRTALSGADGVIYAVAQGAVAVTGFDARGDAERLTQGVPTAGRIANGAIVERAQPGDALKARTVRLELFNPDFSTAANIADEVNAWSELELGRPVAQVIDHRIVEVTRPARLSGPHFLSMIGGLMISPDLPARVVVNERTGTIVIGSDVRISRVAVTHGELTISVSETPQVSQPEPFSKGETKTVPRTLVEATQAEGPIAIVEGTDLRTLVQGLNRLGLKAPGIIAVLQAIKSSGALHAELIVE